MITLLGASGYTGQRIARALTRPPAPAPLRLAGRSAERLRRPAASLPGSPPWLTADAARPETLPPLFEDCRLLINCAGPFTDHGEAVVAQAARHGVAYLDISNELDYVYRVWDYDPLARRSGAVLVPACGFEVALADCAAARLAAQMPGELAEVRVLYDIGGAGSSRGTRRSALRSLATSWLAYRQGRWQPDIPCRRVRTFPLDGVERAALSFPSAEIAALPRHLPVRRVTTWMTLSPGARWWAPRLLPLFARLVRGPLGRWIEGLVSAAAPPREGMRRQATFAIRVEALSAGERVGTQRAASLLIKGQGVYELTAQIVAYAAARLLSGGGGKAGVLAPAQALEPEELLAHAVAHWGLEVRDDA